MGKNNYIFLLGGSDLEMTEIKRILKRRKLSFEDRNLTWGNASWEAYQDLYEFPEDRNKIFVGIELQDKDSRPQNSIDIDHHGELEGRNSALEQLIDLLEIPESFTWRRQLIAANDTGYIPAMQKLGASKEEIEKIRRLDRKAQGVSEQDEKLAEKAIRENCTSYGGLKLIRAFNDKFSPITDRLFGHSKQHIIYTENELTYFGKNRDKVANLFQEELESERVYLGGGTSGYIGLINGQWSEEEILSARDEIIELLTEEKSQEEEKETTLKEEIYSHHIFLFPFKWRVNDDESFFDLSHFNSLCSGKWESSKFNLEGLDRFNEYNYFYEHVREMLYEKEESLVANESVSQFMRHFEYKINTDSTYNVRLKKEGNDGKQIEYSLAIDTIILNVYKMGTAVLSFHLRNHEYSNPEDILNINMYGRRVAVPFFDLKPVSIYSGVPDQSGEDNEHDILKGTKLGEIPDAIWLNIDNRILCDDFSSYREKENYQKNPFILPSFIKNLFPKDFIADQKSSKDSITISHVLDDRMHVISWFGHTKTVNELKVIKRDYSNDRKTDQPFYAFETADFWQNYVFVDTGVMQTNRFIRHTQLEAKTYSRFIEYGTLYGVSRYSFVMLTKNFSDLGNFNYLVRHLQSMYYKMVELCLLQRATILQFSDETALLAQKVLTYHKDHDTAHTNSLSDRITELYRRYIFFVNRIYFREVTTQEQGIELYDMIQKSMRLPQEVKNLDEEIRELNAFVEMENSRRSAKEQEKLAKDGHRLTIIATAFLIPTLIAGIAGMNTFPPLAWKITETPNMPLVYSAIAAVVPGLLFLLVRWIVKLILRRKKFKKIKK
ncbi:MAG: hypothetical protein HWE22_10335 [Flavobacteriales bacterium]|nr:hypothetical protein [Flavobacteriales bacterium]